MGLQFCSRKTPSSLICHHFDQLKMATMKNYVQVGATYFLNLLHKIAPSSTNLSGGGGGGGGIGGTGGGGIKRNGDSTDS